MHYIYFLLIDNSRNIPCHPEINLAFTQKMIKPGSCFLKPLQLIQTRLKCNYDFIESTVIKTIHQVDNLGFCTRPA